MTDRELLEAAAKAAGYDDAEFQNMEGWGEVRYGFSSAIWSSKLHDESGGGYWNPLTDDGDALRLAVKLEIPVFPYDDETSTGTVGVVAKNWGSKEANTRRAIVRAAAALSTDGSGHER